MQATVQATPTSASGAGQLSTLAQAAGLDSWQTALRARVAVQASWGLASLHAYHASAEHMHQGHRLQGREGIKDLGPGFRSQLQLHARTVLMCTL
jgi:hypothetical protein